MDGMSSAFSLSNIPAGLAKRVEVYKGVVPIELGGDALGGAINIVTDNSRRTRVNASYSYGSFNTHKSNVYAEHTTKNGFYVSLNAYQNYSDNDYKVHIDSYTKGDGSGQVVEGDFTVRRFHAMYHNEAAILKSALSISRGQTACFSVSPEAMSTSRRRTVLRWIGCTAHATPRQTP